MEAPWVLARHMPSHPTSASHHGPCRCNRVVPAIAAAWCTVGLHAVTAATGFALTHLDHSVHQFVPTFFQESFALSHSVLASSSRKHARLSCHTVPRELAPACGRQHQCGAHQCGARRPGDGQQHKWALCTALRLFTHRPKCAKRCLPTDKYLASKLMRIALHRGKSSGAAAVTGWIPPSRQ